jgi:hypothetical protein
VSEAVRHQTAIGVEVLPFYRISATTSNVSTVPHIMRYPTAKRALRSARWVK